MRTVDVGTQIIEAQGVDGRIGAERVGVRGVHHRDLRPRLQLAGRHVLPGRATVRRHVDRPVVGADPDAVDVPVGRRDCINDPFLRRPRGGRAFVDADVVRHLPCLARQVRADLRPPLHAAGRRFPQRVRRKVQHVRIDRREEDRLRADGPILARLTAGKGFRRHVDDDAGLPIVAADLATVDDVGVDRMNAYL